MTGSSAGEIIVHELVGGYADPGGSKEKKNSNERRDPKHCHYREIGRRNLSRKTIAANADGTWTLVTPSAPSSAKKNHTKRHGNNVTVSAAEVQHVNGVMTFGYVVEEEEPQRNMDVKKAKAAQHIRSSTVRKTKGLVDKTHAEAMSCHSDLAR